MQLNTMEVMRSTCENRHSVELAVDWLKSYLFSYTVGQYPILDLAHQFIRLLGKSESEDLSFELAQLKLEWIEQGTYRMRQYPCQMRTKPLVNSQDTFSPDSSPETVKSIGIEIPRLIVHPTHHSVWRVHDTADHETGTSTAGKM